MKSSTWAALLREIPAEQYNQLMIVTAAGIEIALQSILRIDHEFLAIKGRLAGSQDAGRVFFVPYSHIDYLGFLNAVKESEFLAMFGNLIIADGAPPPAADAAANPGTPPPVGPSRAGTPIKSAVLERFRSRVTSSGSGLRPSLDG